MPAVSAKRIASSTRCNQKALNAAPRAASEYEHIARRRGITAILGRTISFGETIAGFIRFFLDAARQ
jgi:hypothetical protein